MRSVKLAMLLLVALTLGWTGGMALAGEASPAPGEAGAATGRMAVPRDHAALERIEGMIIGIARTRTTTTLTIRVPKADTPKRDIRVELTGQTPIHQGVLARTWRDLTVGSHVWLDCEPQNGKLQADEIGIIDPPVHVLGVEGPDENS